MRGSELEVAEVASRSYWREEDARILVDAWRRSGESKAGFAKRHGVDPRRLARWAARLNKERGAMPMRFHAVRVTDGESNESIEIALGDGRRVRVPSGFRTEDLRRVLALLAGEAAC